MSTRLEAAPTAIHLSDNQVDHLRGLLIDEHTVQEARALELQDPIDLEPDLADVLLTRCYEAMEEIDAALARLELGSYGSCLGCGSAIPYERLEVVPAADRCVTCQFDRDRSFR
jgi:DnaK suppressor protein